MIIVVSSNDNHIAHRMPRPSASRCAVRPRARASRPRSDVGFTLEI